MEYVTLNNGVKMPMVGFGVFNLEGTDCERCVLEALEAGYRLIDTAQAYHNEEYVGNALAISGVPREEVFLTTKIWVTEHTYEEAKASIFKSLRKLKTDYLDLVLIHQPLSDYYAAYHAMEELYKIGKLRAIGISNFSPERMADLAVFNKVRPAVNQVETHIFFQQEAAHQWMKKYHVQHEAWGPLAEHRVQEVVGHPVLGEISAKYGKTAAQTALRFQLQRGVVIIPKTAKREHMKENIDLFDFTLTNDDMARLSLIDEGKSMWCSYDDPQIVELAMS